MEKLPPKSGIEVMKTFFRMGFKRIRVRGSHHVFLKGNIKVTTPLKLKKGTLRGIIKDAGITVKEFLENDP